MVDFSIDNLNYSYTYCDPNEWAKYGLAITYWKTNTKDLEFFLNFINKTWPNRHLINISICSSYEVEPDILDRIKPLVNYIVHCETDLGHQNGTTINCNGAIYPLYHDSNILTITHTDADTIILHYNYFFGFANILLDSNKLMIASTLSWDFDHLNGKIVINPHQGPGTGAEKQFGSMFVLNTNILKETRYWPFPLLGHFEYDRYTHFINCGLSLEDDVILIKRMCFNKPAHENILYGSDFHLGVMHSTNTKDEYDRVDRKTHLLQIMGIEL